MWAKKIKRPGFTIVELLVVIVVVGILAAITLVSYTGIQNNAYNANIINVVQSYTNALKAYTSINDSYPPVPSEAVPSDDDRICLGIGYTDHNSDTIPDCGNSDYPSREYTPFNDELKKLITLPVASSKTIHTPWQTSTFTGVTLIRQDEFTVNTVPNPYYIMYALMGTDQDCKLKVVEQVSEADPFPHMKTTDLKSSWFDGTSTMCVVPLENI